MFFILFFRASSFTIETKWRRCKRWLMGKSNGNMAENHYTIINCEGEIILDYIKIHPFSYSGEDI
jgi:hypothetical protein